MIPDGGEKFSMAKGMASDISLRKFNPFADDIIFIDGLWGTGKSLLYPIVSGMEGVEKAKAEHVYDSSDQWWVF